MKICYVLTVPVKFILRISGFVNGWVMSLEKFHSILFFIFDSTESKKKSVNIQKYSENKIADDMNKTLETILKRPYSQSL